MLAEYVMENAVRGDCRCGQCVDGPPPGMGQQPTGHTADVVFFRVAAKPGASAETLKALVKVEQPGYLDGVEHSYIQVGADLGNQGVGLMLIGLGAVLGVWSILSVDSIMPGAPDELRMALAGRGLVCLMSGGPRE